MKSLPKRHNGPSHNRPPVVFAPLVRFVATVLSGSTDVPAHLRAEQQSVVLRYLGILCLIPTLPLFHLSTPRLVGAYTLLIFAAIYNTGVQILLHRRPRWLNDGYITTIGDGLLSIAMLAIGGGFTSSFYFILFTATVAAAVRYGYKPSMLVVAIYVLLDAITIAVTRYEPLEASGDFLVRSSFLAITVLLAGYLREHARAAEGALAQQLRHASALNESTHALSASLNMDTVVQIVVAEARRLVDADAAALWLGPVDGDMIAFNVATGMDPQDDLAHTRQATLTTLISTASAGGAHGLQRGVTGDGHWYMVAPLDHRHEAPGRIAVLRAPDGAPYAQADEGLLTAFIDRAALAIEKASLYATLDERSRDLQRAYADLAAAHQELLGVDEMKTNFIANVSHELRTPLTSIRSFSEILLSLEIDLETQREFMGIINAESERLTRLINDVLDITKIESGYVEWHMDDHDLAELLRASARTFAALAEEKQLQFAFIEPQGPIYVWADGDRVLQVLVNLLSNAIKFTSHGGVSLSVEVSDEMARVHVRDTGIGIASVDHERIFEKFHQVGNTLTGKPTGTGLGLCICRDIVEYHGGRIWVESALGEGSVFSFTLPLVKAPVPGMIIENITSSAELPAAAPRELRSFTEASSTTR